MTYASDLGLKVGSKIKYTGNKSISDAHEVFMFGDILTLEVDNGGTCPFFSCLRFKGHVIEEYPFQLEMRCWQPVIEVSSWFGKKYKVTPETSELLQKEVFKDGGRWSGDLFLGTLLNKEVKYTTSQYIYVDAAGVIKHGIIEKYFILEDLPEGVIEIEKSIKLAKVIDKVTEDEIEYNKLMEQIENLKLQAAKFKPQEKK